MSIKIPAPANKQKGFTLLEIVIAIGLIVILTTLLLTSFGPWMRFKQRLDTESRLRDLAQATTALYKANAFQIDDTNPVSAYNAAYGAIDIDGTNKINTNCPIMVAGTDPSEIDNASTPVLTNLLPLQPYAASDMETLVRDGFNNAICVFVSPRQDRTVAGAKLYYHSVAFVSIGEDVQLDPTTSFVYDAVANVWTLKLGGDDRGVMTDGFQIANDNYRTTMEKLHKLTKAYETYFNVRYLSKADRDITKDYFYANNGTNNGDSGTAGEPVPPSIGETRAALGSTWSNASFDNIIVSTIGIKLGVSATDGYDAWGKPLIIDNRSPRVRSGTVAATGTIDLPPYTAMIGALLPGTTGTCGGDPNNQTLSCDTFISSTAVGTY